MTFSLVNYPIGAWAGQKIYPFILGLPFSGALDLHLHCGPEAIPRKYDFIELSKNLKENQIGGAVIKSHFHSTAPWAYMASSMGIKKIVLTHPLYASTGLSKDDMIELIQHEGVYVEQSYGLVLIDGLPVSDIIDYIKVIGANRTLLISDLGQCQTVDPAEGIQEYIDLLTELGISYEEITQMIKTNPKKLLDI